MFYIVFCLAGLEVYKQTPQSIRSTVTTLEELTEAGIQNTSQYMSIAFFSRIDLVKSIVAFKEKQVTYFVNKSFHFLF